MGYYTRHKIEVWSDDEAEVSSIQSALEKESGYGKQLFEDSVKWYDGEEHSALISQRFPKIAFSIYGEGEEAFDVWRHDYFNGKKVGEWKPEIQEIPDPQPDAIAKWKGE